MRKLASAVIMFAALQICPCTTHAWEFKRNPDRFPSIGFNTSTQKLSGSRLDVSMPTPILTLPQHSSKTEDFYSIGGDVRLPVTDSLTITGYADYIQASSEAVREGNVFRQTDNTTGARFGLSVRLYFNK